MFSEPAISDALNTYKTWKNVFFHLNLFWQEVDDLNSSFKYIFFSLGFIMISIILEWGGGRWVPPQILSPPPHIPVCPPNLISECAPFLNSANLFREGFLKNCSVFLFLDNIQFIQMTVMTVMLNWRIFLF